MQLDGDLLRELNRLATSLGTDSSELLRRGARAVIEAGDLAAADRELIAAYRRLPPDPSLVLSAERLAALTAPPW